VSVHRAHESRPFAPELEKCCFELGR
jgi:hypothetical protein